MIFFFQFYVAVVIILIKKKIIFLNEMHFKKIQINTIECKTTFSELI